MRLDLCFHAAGQTLALSFRDHPADLSVDFGDVVVVEKQGDRLPDYDGPTEVQPSLETQTLATKGTSVHADISVLPIKTTRVSNTAGGVTFLI